MKAKLIGILGGTFNPIHKGHVEMCEVAMAQFDLDGVAILVSGNPPHKASGVVHKTHRLEMAALAVAHKPNFVVLRLEIEREGKTYTVDTLKYLREVLPDAQLFYIIGSDTLLTLHTWYKVQDVFELTEFICFYRSGDLPGQIHARVKRNFAKKRHAIHFADYTIPPISSTDIRVALSQGIERDEWLHPDVLAYILTNRLYQDEALNFSQAKQRLEQALKSKRYEHTLGVVKTAVKLAKQYGVNQTKAKWAALLHDCARDLDAAQCTALCEKNNIVLDAYMTASPALLHAALGAILAKEAYLIKDEQILDAIACHTVGRQGMSDLDKILYLADAIEPNRAYHNVKQLRKIAFENLDEAVRITMESSILFVIQKNEIIHPSTILARNELLLKDTNAK